MFAIHPLAPNEIIMKNVEELFFRSGLSAFKSPPLSKMWVFGDGPVKPFFLPIIQKRYGGVIISGGLGLHIEDFENYWRKYYENHVGEVIKIDTFALITHMYNIEEFVDWPLFDKDLEASDGDISAEYLVHSICKYLDRMPKSLGELEDSFCNGLILDVDINKYFGHWVKLNHLSKWAKSGGYNCIAHSAGLVRKGRSDPFEKIISFM